MAAVSYDLDIEEVWEFLDIWAAGGNSEATKLLAGLKATVVRAGPARIDPPVRAATLSRGAVICEVCILHALSELSF